MTKTDVKRRQFLAALGLGGAAAAAAVAGRKGAESPQQAPAGAPRSAGYRLTEHVRRYYETAKV